MVPIRPMGPVLVSGFRRVLKMWTLGRSMCLHPFCEGFTDGTDLDKKELNLRHQIFVNI